VHQGHVPPCVLQLNDTYAAVLCSVRCRPGLELCRRVQVCQTVAAVVDMQRLTLAVLYGCTGGPPAQHGCCGGGCSTLRLHNEYLDS
jgi:hypothetical protein